MRAFLDEYAPIIIGVVLGAMAHFGRMIQIDGWPSFRTIIGFVMQLGLVALASAAAAERLGIESNLMRSLTASVLTVATNEVVNWFRLNWAVFVTKLRSVGFLLFGRSDV